MSNQSLLENYQGKLLIAHPRLPVGNPFKETVIYVTQDTEEATIGLIFYENWKSSAFNLNIFKNTIGSTHVLCVPMFFYVLHCVL